MLVAVVGVKLRQAGEVEGAGRQVGEAQQGSGQRDDAGEILQPGQQDRQEAHEVVPIRRQFEHLLGPDQPEHSDSQREVELPGCPVVWSTCNVFVSRGNANYTCSRNEWRSQV